MIECVQGSVEWFNARRGIPSASNFDKIVTTKGTRSTQREKYLYRLAGEAICGASEETFQSMAMARGTELEAEAREYYSFLKNATIDPAGFFLKDGYGASPDGLVGQEGLIELKCPLIATHVSYLLDNKLPTEYFQQVQGELLSSDRKWCDFMSYYPGLRPLIIRVQRDETFLTLLKIELKAFCDDLESVIERIK